MAKNQKMSKKTSAPTPDFSSGPELFGKENYIWILAGLAMIGIGLILMSGGKSEDPQVFDPGQVYSFTRITLAPILILAGLAMQVFAIFRKPKR